MAKSKYSHTHSDSIIAASINPTPEQVYRAARAYRDAGLSLLPIEANLTKMPAFSLLPQVWCERREEYRRSWGVFRERRPTPAEIQAWYRDRCYGKVYGIAVLGGQVSGGLEILDLDTFELVAPFCAEVETRRPGLIDRLVQVKTPRPGLHLYYRCETIEGNQKLARIPDPEADKPKPKTIIETKGEGGYCLAPPSPRWCHPRQQCYTFLGDKDLTIVPTITPEERQALFDAARTFDRWRDLRRSTRPRRASRPRLAGGLLRPGDDFCARADWADILEPHGWTYVGAGSGETELWRRPGKKEGVSATTNYGGNDLLYVFSCNADPFEAEESYTKFHAFALLEHDGDFCAAANQLRRHGYGAATKLRSHAGRLDLAARYAGHVLRSRESR